MYSFKHKWLFALLLLPSLAFAQTEVGLKWKPLGPFQDPIQTVKEGEWTPMGMGWIESLAVYSKDEKYIYAGSNSGGIFCTGDGGKHWKNVTPDGLVTGVLDIVISDEDPNELWIATGTPVNHDPLGRGVLYSKNGGKTWTETGLKFKEDGGAPCIWQLERSRSHPDIFYAASETAIYKSTDRCVTFTKVYEAADDALFRNLIIHPSNPDLVACSGKRMFVSRNGGQTWSDVTKNLQYNHRKDGGGDPERIAVAFQAKYDMGLCATYKSGTRNFIDESADWGTTWINLNVNRDFIRLDRNHAEIEMLGQDLVLVGSVRLFEANVVKNKIDILTMPVYGRERFAHDDIREIEKTTSGHIYIATDGGVSVSRDSGNTWQNLSGTGLTVTQIYGIDGIYKGENTTIAIGCQDLGTTVYRQGQWVSISKAYGDGGKIMFKDSTGLLFMQNGRMLYSSDTGNSYQSMGQPFLPNRFNYPVVRTTNGWLIGDRNLWLHTDGNRWERISGKEQEANSPIIAVAHHPDGTTYFANDEPTWGNGEKLKNRLYKGKLIGDSVEWTDITANLTMLAWKSITDIVIDPENSDHVWLSLYGFDGKENYKAYKIFYSENGGQSWTNVSFGLRNYSAYCLKLVPGTDGGILIGMDDGIYYRDRTMNECVKLAGKMPWIMTKDIYYEPETHTVYAGTYGNGVWYATLPKKFFR